MPLLVDLLSALMMGFLVGSEGVAATKVMLGRSGVTSEGKSSLNSFDVFPSFRSNRTTKFLEEPIQNVVLERKESDASGAGIRNVGFTGDTEVGGILKLTNVADVKMHG